MIDDGPEQCVVIDLPPPLDMHPGFDEREVGQRELVLEPDASSPSRSTSW